MPEQRSTREMRRRGFLERALGAAARLWVAATGGALLASAGGCELPKKYGGPPEPPQPPKYGGPPPSVKKSWGRVQTKYGGARPPRGDLGAPPEAGARPEAGAAKAPATGAAKGKTPAGAE